MTEDEAFNKARAVSVDGEGLYIIEADKWEALYDVQGFVIHDALQRSNYGHVRSPP